MQEELMVEKRERLLRRLNEDTAFMFHEDMNISGVAHNKRRTADEVSRLFLGKQLALSDIFILKAVHSLGFGTPEMVAQKLKLMKRYEPEKIIPVANDASIRNRMIVLCESGLLIGQTVSCAGFSHYNIYCCSEIGFMILRKKLGRSIYGDNLLACDSGIEMFRKLSAVYALLALSRRMKCEYVKGYIRDDTFKKEGVKPYLYGKMKIVHKEKILSLVSQPMYFGIDVRVEDIGYVQEKYISELKQLSEWIKLQKLHNNQDVLVVIVVENVSGLREAAKMIHGVAPELEECIVYTSERVLRSFSGEENYAFMRVVFGDECFGKAVDIAELIDKRMSDAKDM